MEKNMAKYATPDRNETPVFKKRVTLSRPYRLSFSRTTFVTMFETARIVTMTVTILIRTAAAGEWGGN